MSKLFVGGKQLYPVFKFVMLSLATKSTKDQSPNSKLTVAKCTVDYS
jgi:hypothetical protein